MSLTKTICVSSVLLSSLGLAGCALVPQPHRLNVSCQVRSVQLGAAETSLALPGKHRLRGEAIVDCTSDATQDQNIQVALMSRSAPVVVLSTAARARSAGLEMQLFEDELQRHPMVVAGAGAPDVLHEVRVPAQSQTRLSIPFFALILVPEVLSAGIYSAESNLLIFTRSKP